MEGVKAAVHDALLEQRKAEEIAKSEDHAGPYNSPAMAVAGI